MTDRMVFLHVPKTGGSWVTEAVGAAGVTVRGPDPGGDQSYSSHGHAALGDVEIGERFSVAFVRHPLDWWRSYWGHRMRAGWDLSIGIDAEAASDDFNRFVLKLLERRSDSFDQIVRRFVGSPGQSVDFVGRFETLVDDTCRALRLGGERFSAEAIRARPPDNANDYGRFPALYRPEVAAKLAEWERGTIERFYREDPVPRHLIEGGTAASERPETSAEDRLRRVEEHVLALERALTFARQSETRLESDLNRAQSERERAEQALASLNSSHLLRYTRPLRVSYYRTRSSGAKR